MAFPLRGSWAELALPFPAWQQVGSRRLSQQKGRVWPSGLRLQSHEAVPSGLPQGDCLWIISRSFLRFGH